MYASVHTDRTGRVYVSDDHRASGWDGHEHVPLSGVMPLPQGARLVPLERDAEAFGRDGHMRGLGRGRVALAAVLPRGYTRLLFPSYSDDRAAAPLAALPYTSVGAAPGGDLVVAAAGHGTPPAAAAPTDPAGDIQQALRSWPGNDLVRQLARCAREHECRAARAALAGDDEIPVPIGAPPAERPTLPVDLRSGYPGAPREQAAFHPTAEEISQRVTDSTRRIAFGRACDGDPLLATREMEEAVSLLRARHPQTEIDIETTGCSPSTLRRLIDAGIGGITIRFGSAMPDTYSTLHGPIAHTWTEVRASIALASERGVRLTLALLVLPGVTDREAEADATLGLIGDLPGGTLELRDLGADPLRTLSGLPPARPLGVRALLERLAEADHFKLSGLGGGAASSSRGGLRPPAGTPR